MGVKPPIAEKTAAPQTKVEKQPKESFTREEVELLLKRQIAECAARIEGNTTEYYARTKILGTKPVDF